MALPPGIYERRGRRGLAYQAKVQVPAGLRHLYPGDLRQLTATHGTIEEATLWRIAVARCHAEARPWEAPRPGALSPATMEEACADWLRARVAEPQASESG